ncbi:MAG: hypothetical protein Q8M34_12055 [Thermodesulfovibrionales bacterium]|nr:hypothetical protein [Thermodesulfovibrionales bacterium]
MKANIIEGCPSCSSIGELAGKDEEKKSSKNFRLSHWPIQIKLMGTVIPFLNNAELLVAADCTAFAVPEFQERFLKDKKLLIGCPKLDNAQAYIEKFTEIFSTIPIKSVSCLRMEVPCCGGMTAILREAINKSGKDIPFAETIIGVKGDMLAERGV